MLSEFIAGALRIFVDINRRTTQIERRNADLRLDEFKTVTMKLKVVNDLRQERTSAAGERRVKARMKFFRCAGAADRLATLKHERFESRPGEIVSGDQTVVAGANDDDVFLECAGKAKRRRRFGFRSIRQ